MKINVLFIGFLVLQINVIPECYASPITNFGEEGESAVTFAVPPTLEEPYTEFKGEEWRGWKCGVKNKSHQIFTNEIQWRSFWSEFIAPYQKKMIPVPKIDFSKEVVVGVFRGEKETPSFDIQIVDINKNNSETRVSFKTIDHLVGLSSPRIAVQPFHLKKILAPAGPVQFVPVKE